MMFDVYFTLMLLFCCCFCVTWLSLKSYCSSHILHGSKLIESQAVLVIWIILWFLMLPNQFQNHLVCWFQTRYHVTLSYYGSEVALTLPACAFQCRKIWIIQYDICFKIKQRLLFQCSSHLMLNNTVGRDYEGYQTFWSVIVMRGIDV